MDLEEALARVAETDNRVSLAAVEVEAAVKRARDQGASWAQIGTALGVTKQAARQRFGS